MCADLVVIRKIELPGGGDKVEILGVCPGCGGFRFQRNGKTRAGKVNYKCKACGKQSDLDPDNRTIPPAVRAIIDKLFGEGLRVSLVHRVTGVSRSWLYSRHKKFTALEHST